MYIYIYTVIVAKLIKIQIYTYINIEYINIYVHI